MRSEGMSATATKAEPRQQDRRGGEAPFLSCCRGFAPLIVAFGSVMFACPSSQAQGPSTIEDRVAAVCDLVAEEPIPPLTEKRVAETSVFAESDDAAAWLYQEVAPEPASSGSITQTDLATVESGVDAAAGDSELVRTPRPRPAAPKPPTGRAAAFVAPEAEFLRRFAGSFSGSGQIQRSATQSPNNVRCTLNGQPSETGIAISGKCGSFFFSKRIAADIRYDRQTGRYSGVYVGAGMGPAQLAGRRHGDAVVLTVTWPKPVYGDTKATMTIVNPGNRSLLITVSDRLEAEGRSTEVTRLALDQR